MRLAHPCGSRISTPGFPIYKPTLLSNLPSVDILQVLGTTFVFAARIASLLILLLRLSPATSPMPLYLSLPDQSISQVHDIFFMISTPISMPAGLAHWFKQPYGARKRSELILSAVNCLFALNIFLPLSPQPVVQALMTISSSPPLCPVVSMGATALENSFSRVKRILTGGRLLKDLPFTSLQAMPDIACRITNPTPSILALIFFSLPKSLLTPFLFYLSLLGLEMLFMEPGEHFFFGRMDLIPLGLGLTPSSFPSLTGPLVGIRREREVPPFMRVSASPSLSSWPWAVGLRMPGKSISATTLVFGRLSSLPHCVTTNLPHN